MAKQLIINETHSECRIALCENGEILDLLIDRNQGGKASQYASVGNIYLGRVLRVLPGMQSAFIDIGQDRAAFLYVDDAYLPTIEEQRKIAEKIREQEQLEAEQRKEQATTLQGQMIPDEMSTLSETVNMKFRPEVKIQDFLKEGERIVVQVAKEPISTKGPRVTRHITLAGRHIVFMPYIEHTGVSRRIEKDEERDRLKEVIESIKPEGVGVIARTVAEGQSHKTLKNDFVILNKQWKDILKKIDRTKTPGEIYQDLNFIQRALRDIADDDVDEILVDHKSTKTLVEKFLGKFLPDLKSKVKHYTEETPIFELYGIDLEVERALSNKVYLKSGGSINVDQTEALVSIDVNTGKFVGKKTLEDTILKTNLEAVKEIAYQMRLRNCGGIIIIDFIDMDREEHRDAVYQALLEALKKDRAKTNVLPISGLGLVEMTRKRTRDTLIRSMCEPCSYCEGTGRVKTVETMCYEVIRELNKTMRKTVSIKVSLFAHPEVCARLTGDEFNVIEMMEEVYTKKLTVRADNSYHVEQYEIYASDIS